MRATAAAPTAASGGWITAIPALKTSLAATGFRPSRLAPSAHEQALRPPHQDHDHEAVDDERAELGDVVLAGHVCDTEQQSRQQRPGNGRGAAHRDYDQEIDHELQWKRR